MYKLLVYFGWDALIRINSQMFCFGLWHWQQLFGSLMCVCAFVFTFRYFALNTCKECYMRAKQRNYNTEILWSWGILNIWVDQRIYLKMFEIEIFCMCWSKNLPDCLCDVIWSLLETSMCELRKIFAPSWTGRIGAEKCDRFHYQNVSK